MRKKSTGFTKTILTTLLLGSITGIAMIILREQLVARNYGNLWTQIYNVFFADITAPGNERAIGIFFIIGQIFLRLLQVLLIPLIFTSIIRAIEHIKDTQLLNKMAKKGFMNFVLLLSIALVVGSIFGLGAYSMGLFKLNSIDIIPTVEATAKTSNPLMMILNSFQPNFVSTLGNNGNVMAIVVLAIIIGVLFQTMRETLPTLIKLVNEVYLITLKCLNFVIMKLSPIGIFSLLVRTFAEYGVQYLTPALVYMFTTTFALLTILTIIFPLLVWFKTGIKPLVFLRKIYKVVAFGFSTSSSAATLPLAQETVIKDFGVSDSVASFIVPLASTINMTGTAIMQIIATLFIASVAGYEIGVIQMVSIIGLTIIGSISTPAAPGAGAILLFTIISGMGYLNPAAVAAYSLIIAINRPVEMLVTAVNVVDDVVSAIMIEESLKEHQTIKNAVIVEAI